MTELTTLDDYRDVVSVLKAAGDEVNGYDFYREIFPNNENTGDNHQDFSHPNAIYLFWDEAEGRRSRRVMLKDTWEDDYLKNVEGNTHTLCGGLAYRRNANRLENAQRMHALVFDLDGVGEHELRNVLHRCRLDPEQLRSLPVPTFIVASGNGIHLYYVFEEPIDLYPNIKVQLKSLKYDLTFKIWEYKSTSREKQIQYQSINQAFRMPGSINEKYGNVIRAFRCGDKVSIEYMNKYAIDKKNCVDLQKRFRPSKMTLEAARETYPEWYDRVIVEGIKSANKWDIAGKVNGEDPYALYHWWMRQIKHIRGGHRYFFLMCMAIYASKCDVPKAKLEADMWAAFDKLRAIEHSNPMKREDIKSALEMYSKEYYNFKLSDIEKLTDVRIERNKRNGRKRNEHLRRARAVQTIDYPEGEWRNTEGRPKGSKDKKPRKNKREQVEVYRRLHPDKSKADCARDLKLDPKTVRKWWGELEKLNNSDIY